MKTILAVLLGLSLASAASAQVVVPYSANVQLPTFVVSSGAIFPDGSSGAPGAAFGSELTLGFYRIGAGQLGIAAASSVTVSSSLFAASDLRVGSASTFYWLSRALMKSPADGIVTFANQANAIGAEFKVDALPVASSCGAGSPAVVAGSTPLTGSVTVGTGGPLTCTITFGGTAYPSAPHCNGAVETTTAANARAMGYSASATVLTIVPATAWADSSVVNWACLSSK